MNLSIGQEIFVKGVEDTRAFVREVKWNNETKSIKIEVSWKDRDGRAMGRSVFFDHQEGVEWSLQKGSL